MLKHSLYKKFGKKFMQTAGVMPNTEDALNDDVRLSSSRLQTDIKLPNQNFNGQITVPKTYSDKEVKAMKKSFAFTGEDFFTPNKIATGPVDIGDVGDSLNGLSTTENLTNTPASVRNAQKINNQVVDSLEEDNSFEIPDMIKDAGKYIKNNAQPLSTMGLTAASTFLNEREDRRVTDEFNRSIQQRQSKPTYDYNWMYGRTTSGGTEYQPIIMAQKGAKISSRNNTPEFGANNVEIENNEYLILPDGSSELASGATHEESYNVGGQTMSGVNTNLPEGTLVFSDFLTPGDVSKMSPEEKVQSLHSFMQSGGSLDSLDLNTFFTGGQTPGKRTGKDANKTFAQIAKKYDNTEYQKILENPFAKQVDKNTASLMMTKNNSVLEKLFQEQQLINGNSNGETKEVGMENGGINNPGFKALPEEVQSKIIASMAKGGTSPKSAPDKAGLPKALQPYVKWDAGAGKEGSWRLEVPPNLPVDEIRKITQAANTFGYKNLIQTSNERLQDNPNASFKGFYAGLRPQDFERKLIEEELGVEEANKLDELQTRQKAFEMLGIDGSQYDLNDPQSLYNNPQFANKFYSSFTSYLPDSKFRPDLGDDVKLGFEHLDAIKGKKKPGPQEPAKEEPKQANPKPGEAPAFVPPKFGTYERTPYDLMQAVPGAYALAQSQEIFPYAIPEIDAPYLRPQTLNIQSELQDIDNMGQSALRAGADPNMIYAMGLDAKNKAFQAKSNYDAEGRSKADIFNAQSSFDAGKINAELFDRTYNNLYATARANQSEAKQASLTNLIENRAMHNQEENIKELYSKNFMPSYSYDQETKTWNPVGNPVYNYNKPATSATTTTTTTTSKKGAYLKIGGKLYKEVKSRK